MTHYRNFRVNEKTNVRVPMMTNKGNYLVAADHDLDCDVLQVGGQSSTKMFSQTGTRKQFNLTAPQKYQISFFQLPYTGNISMLIALPRKLTGMRSLEQEISPTVVNKWLKNMTNRSAAATFNNVFQ